MSTKAPLSYRTTNLTLGTFLRMMFRPRYLGKDKIPVEGPLIIAANHLSHIDPAFIMTATKRPVSYMSKKEHFDGAIRRLVFKQVGVIPVDREEGGKDALKGAIEILEDVKNWFGQKIEPAEIHGQIKSSDPKLFFVSIQ